MDYRAVGWVALGMVSIGIGLGILLWPSYELALNDRIPFGLLFVIPGVIGLSKAKLLRREETS